MNDIKTIIEKIYRDYNPDKISNVPNLLEKYKGKEAEMLSKLSEKYSLHLEDYISVDYLRLVKEILKKHDPVNVTSASSMLASYTGREKELLKTLGDKFNAGFNDIIISMYSVASPNQDPFAMTGNKSPVFQKIETATNETSFGIKSKNLIIGLSAAAVIIITLVVLYFSGVFNPHAVTNSNISVSTSVNKNSVSDATASNSAASSNNPSNSNSINSQNDKQDLNVQGRFPFATTRLLEISDLSGLGNKDLKIMRNEIYARHGYIFKTPEMKEYFAAQSWYHGQYADVSSMLSAIEQRNVALIKKYE